MWTPWNQDVLFNQDPFVLSQLGIISLLTSGHFSNQDTLSRSQKCPHFCTVFKSVMSLLYNSALTMIVFTSLGSGLAFSAVKDICCMHSSNTRSVFVLRLCKYYHQTFCLDSSEGNLESSRLNSQLGANNKHKLCTRLVRGELSPRALLSCLNPFLCLDSTFHCSVVELS